MQMTKSITSNLHKRLPVDVFAFEIFIKKIKAVITEKLEFEYHLASKVEDFDGTCDHQDSYGRN